ATKDRMYCDAGDSPRRLASQCAMFEIFQAISKLLAPILAFTADEAWEHAPFTTGRSGKRLRAAAFAQRPRLRHRVLHHRRTQGRGGSGASRHCEKNRPPALPALPAARAAGGERIVREVR
ncbi:MAG: class I tRNA ligase family protein, partial [Akkermansiaceae bacterium]|nr:class I tRNA ligase family protein [Akkermansiaceae bacterium]